MSDNFKALEGWAAGLLGNLSTKELRGMNKKLAMELRKRQQAHIAAQQNPDGTPYAPRLPQQRKKKGRIKRQMFAKLRTTRHLKTQSSDNGAVVRFSPSTARIAQIHQFGLSGRVNKTGTIKHKYAARVLLGFSQSDNELIAETILSQISK
ncbi:phage virion morphogenesis protein [Iodobacter fluviatilis]|uniref:Mu-like prophage protein gpG n=1 Tax=Iodobacter fluviatilis TaxID=537 RepID=A0A377Q298_9NEIS|nr:phage virion morphogenesis protein [Iodobacter fluviatilis]TCU90267.1 phage virion morphogenesis protein [Iodobacter fluviatilis]STQ89294.1 Mu-like prophage protein gpG [Iodobacter fluviatilis]